MRITELTFMAIASFIIVFGLGGLYEVALREQAIICQEGC